MSAAQQVKQEQVARHTPGYVNPWKLQGGEILVSEGIAYRVRHGFRNSQSSCWRDSRWIEAVQLTGHPACVGQCTWVNPARATLVSAVLGGAA